ncbi:hypothetical protein GCM10007972_21300 [Iodidimonas muriae]|uniref:DUF4440 domain-containing protein n=1 Tax=Iodidimonas muriae TaxID=261467 RepID=A0ABQ2LER0_9PROT|nr:nuclear transport factor 2 family protein [Iodidimonas muriae]GGO14308.1 hypothetical protein GCM10007972_21300 [Iodidimonas muriae]
MIHRIWLFTVFALAMIAAPAFSQQKEKGETKGHQEIEAGMIAEVMRSAEAWNKGDIRGFMHSYWNSDRLRFASGNTVTRGWDSTLQRYLAAYGETKDSMGELRFTDLETTVLSEEAGIVFGRFHLERKGGRSEGLFTLTMKRFGKDWRILSDHTSAAP